MNFVIFQIIIVAINLINVVVGGGPEEAEGVKYADKCEVCKVVVTELENRLQETGKTHDIIETGYSLDDVKSKTKTQYSLSNLRLLETMENLCDKILEYNIHKERTDSTRFEKGMSQTFKTLHGLVNKGVKVELGIPYELWDNPSVEITSLKSDCETLLENHEEDIENWYFNLQGQVPLSRYLCTDRVLKGKSDSCLRERGDSGKIEDKNTKKTDDKVVKKPKIPNKEEL
ncbi:protein canopy homolog 3 [Leptopilina heterotoma]|uniref:protein canopy homolog 3 n=1 Tax=Leptopilina heterotoma TaxID=63436 RepID=UPI001CA82DD8|nr:protein canopy homolog 3 [Leptopilina heterotoma]